MGCFARALPERRQRIGLVLGPILFLGWGLGLHRAGLAWGQSWAAATVALMSCWWITEPIPLWATALLPLGTLPVLSGVPLLGVILQYLDPVNFLFLGGMWIAASMEQWNLHRRIALGIVSKIGVSPRRIILGFMLGTGFVTLWISNTATAMMMFPIAMAVIRKFEERRRRDDPLLCSFGLALMLGLAYAASIGGIGTKIGTGTNLVFVKLSRDVLPNGIDFLSWGMIAMPIVLISLPLVWFYLVNWGAHVPREDFPEGRQAIEEERRRLGRMSRGEVVALVAFLSAAVLWISRKDLDFGAVVIPGWSRLITTDWADFLPFDRWPDYIRKMFTETGDAMVAMIIAGLLFVIPVTGKPRQFALAPRNAARIAWGLLVLLGGGFALAFGIQASGLSKTLAESLAKMPRVDPFLAILVVSLVSVALTEVASNTATASILLPILAVTAPGFGLHPAPVMMAATLAASFGFMLPAGTPPNALVFSSGYVTVPQMARSGLLVDLFGALLVATVCHFLAPAVLNLPSQ